MLRWQQEMLTEDLVEVRDEAGRTVMHYAAELGTLIHL